MLLCITLKPVGVEKHLKKNSIGIKHKNRHVEENRLNKQKSWRRKKGGGFGNLLC